MKTKKMNILISLILFGFILAGCSSDAVRYDFTVSKGEEVRIELTSNPTTGYSWRLNNSEQLTAIQPDTNFYIPSEPVLTGSGGKEIWKFIAVKSGISKIQFEYVRPWEKGSKGELKEFTVQVK